MAATFDLKPDADWQPDYIVSAPTTSVNVPCHDGTMLEFPITETERTVVVSDSRAIRVLKADPRFTLVSED